MAHVPGFTAADLAAYDRQVALSKIGAAQAQAQALMNSQAHRLGAATQQMYDASGYSNVATTQPPLYYHH